MLWMIKCVSVLFTAIIFTLEMKQFSVNSQQCKKENRNLELISKFTLDKIFSPRPKIRKNKIQIFDIFDDDLESTSYLSNIVVELIDELKLVLSHHSNLTILYEDIWKNESCLQAISNSSLDSSITFNMIKNSGKSISDVGLEEECKFSNLTYVFLEFEIDLNVFMIGTDSLYLYKFLSQKQFFWGFCLWKECNQFYRDFLNQNQNQIFFDYLFQYGVTKLKFYDLENKTNIEEFNSQSGFYIFLFVIYFISAYILIRLIVSIIGIFISKEPDEYTRNNNSDEMIDDDSYDYDDDTNKSDLQIYLNSRAYNPNKALENQKSNDKNSCVNKFFKFLDFKFSIKYLIKPKNKYYEETGLEYISFFRVFLFFWATYNHMLYAITKIPHRDFSNLSFYTSIWFAIVKYSIFAIECWVVLNGIVMSYKLMSYIKRNTKDFYVEASFKLFMKFYFNFASKIIIFFVIFFLLHVWMEYYTYYVNKTPMLEYFLNDIINTRNCYDNPMSLFIPFYLQYKDYGDFDPYRGFSNCYRFANIFLNEFYCFTIFIFIFYFAYRFRSKIYDYAIIIIFFLNTCLSFYWYKYDFALNPEGQKMTFLIFLGETIGFKYTHLFINTYAFGVFAGLIYFHYNDVISRNPLENGDDYIPFRYTFDLMKFLDKRKNLAVFCFLFSILMQILISLSFYIFINFFSEYSKNSNLSEETKLNIELNLVIYLTYIYEKKIFSFFFVLMLLSFLIYPKASFIKHLIQSNMLVPFNRISFSYLGTADIIVYLFFSIYNVQIYINHQNLFFFTMGLLFVISLISMILTILFELPSRIIYKNLMRTKEIK